jgi:maltose/moltooligosaccharide transporter
MAISAMSFALAAIATLFVTDGTTAILERNAKLSEAA